MKLSEKANPIDLFHEWMKEAVAEEGAEDATAMSLATIGQDDLPDVRMVLLKGVDERGFVFYTNLESNKGQQLQRNPGAALCFHWKSLARQVRVRGTVEPVSAEEADAYFKSRARESRIGAWASRQSRPLENGLALEKRVALFAAKYALGDIPRPPDWSGFRLKPLSIEFWISRPFRLHERLVFQREYRGESGGWNTVRLYP